MTIRKPSFSTSPFSFKKGHSLIELNSAGVPECSLSLPSFLSLALLSCSAAIFHNIWHWHQSEKNLRNACGVIVTCLGKSSSRPAVALPEGPSRPLDGFCWRCWRLASCSRSCAFRLPSGCLRWANVKDAAGPCLEAREFWFELEVPGWLIGCSFSTFKPLVSPELDDDLALLSKFRLNEATESLLFDELTLLSRDSVWLCLERSVQPVHLFSQLFSTLVVVVVFVLSKLVWQQLILSCCCCCCFVSSFLMQGWPNDFQNRQRQWRQSSRQSAYSSLRSNLLFVL